VSFSASVSFAALELAPDQVRYVQTLDADHAKEADLSLSTASSEAVTKPETTIRKQTSLLEHGAVNLVTKHPPDSPHPRHGVQEVLPTQRFNLLKSQPNRPLISPKNRDDYGAR
jgi:hypothetical protein